MNAQQLHDFIIKPTLEYIGGNYNTVEARFLLLCTAAIESDCGHFIKQVGGPALGIWQMEPKTHQDINLNSDALRDSKMQEKQESLYMPWNVYSDISGVLNNPMYACFMARLKYSMDSQALPKYNGGTDLDLDMFYRYYKRVYNTAHGKSTFNKWCEKINKHGILQVRL